MASLLAALVCVATMILKIPSPFKGYLNLGDGVVLLSAWMLSPMYGFLAVGIGSALADVFSGYAIYAPATFVIKGLMVLFAFYGFKLMSKKLGVLTSRILSGVIAEIIMVLGYLIFESLLYGFMPSIINVPANGLQGIVGVVLGILLIKIFKKSKITF